MPMNLIHTLYVESATIYLLSDLSCVDLDLMITSCYSVKKFLRIMRGTQGALIVASALQIIVGFSGLWRNVAR